MLHKISAEDATASVLIGRGAGGDQEYSRRFCCALQHFSCGIQILLKARRMLTCLCSQSTSVKPKCKLKKALKSCLVNC